MTLDCSKIYLKKGSKGSQVKELQEGLKKLGYYSATVDGDFGEKTKSAVKKLQKDTGHTQDGEFGPKTCPDFNKKLNPTNDSKSATSTFDCTNIDLKRGSKGDLVTRLQTILHDMGLYTRQVDGDFGEYTEEAVKQFQTKNSLAVDGVFGPVTCKKLNTVKSNTNKVTPAKNVVIKKNTEIIIDAKKYNFLKVEEANCTIEGIHFLINQIDDTTSFKVKPWKSVEMMNDKFYDYKGHQQRLQYKLTTFIEDKDYQIVKNALILIQNKKECNIIYKGIESGKYIVSITRSHQNINLWKIVFDIMGV